METIKTKYGVIIIIKEENKSKVDFNKSKFNSMIDFIRFIKDKEMTNNILGY